MHLLPATITLSFLSPLTSALGLAVVKNNCKTTSYLWSVSPSLVGPMNTLVSSGGAYSETYRTDGGISIKLSLYGDSAAMYNGSALTQFQYNVDNSSAKVYYALANTNGAPYDGENVMLAPSDGSCTGTSWQMGRGASTVEACEDGGNLTLTLC